MANRLQKEMEERLMSKVNKRVEMLVKIKKLRDIWGEILEYVEEIESEDYRYYYEFAARYPFERAMEDYTGLLEEWQLSLEEKAFGEHTEIEEEYSEMGDKTFIMELKYEEGELKSMSCVGWYSGTPNEEDTKKFKGSLTGYYNERR